MRCSLAGATASAERERPDRFLVDFVGKACPRLHGATRRTAKRQATLKLSKQTGRRSAVETTNASLGDTKHIAGLAYPPHLTELPTSLPYLLESRETGMSWDTLWVIT